MNGLVVFLQSILINDNSRNYCATILSIFKKQEAFKSTILGNAVLQRNGVNTKTVQ